MRAAKAKLANAKIASTTLQSIARGRAARKAAETKKALAKILGQINTKLSQTLVKRSDILGFILIREKQKYIALTNISESRSSSLDNKNMFRFVMSNDDEQRNPLYHNKEISITDKINDVEQFKTMLSNSIGNSSDPVIKNISDVLLIYNRDSYLNFINPYKDDTLFNNDQKTEIENKHIEIDTQQQEGGKKLSRKQKKKYSKNKNIFSHKLKPKHNKKRKNKTKKQKTNKKTLKGGTGLRIVRPQIPITSALLALLHEKNIPENQYLLNIPKINQLLGIPKKK